MENLKTLITPEVLAACQAAPVNSILSVQADGRVSIGVVVAANAAAFCWCRAATSLESLVTKLAANAAEYALMY